MNTNWPESVPFNFEKLRVAEAAATWAGDNWLVVPGAALEAPIRAWSIEAVIYRAAPET